MDLKDDWFLRQYFPDARGLLLHCLQADNACYVLPVLRRAELCAALAEHLCLLARAERAAEYRTMRTARYSHRLPVVEAVRLLLCANELAVIQWCMRAFPETTLDYLDMLEHAIDARYWRRFSILSVIVACVYFSRRLSLFRKD